MLTALRYRRLPQITGTAAWLVPILSIGPAMWMLWREQFSFLVALIAVAPLLVLAFTEARLAIYATFFYLFLLGDIRRIVGLYIGYPTQDPLLLVGPMITLVLSLPILYRLRLVDPISKLVFAVTVMMTLEIFNPRQGSLSVGLTGAFFQLIPILWFWIGRQYGTDRVVFAVLLRVILPLAVLAALIGLWQTYVGFLPWQAIWIKLVSDRYHSLSVGGFTRAFGFSVNSIEYTNLLLIGSATVLAAFFARRRTYIVLFPLLGTGLFLASSRQPIIKLVIAVALAWSLRSKGRSWVARLPLAIGIGVGLLAFAVLRAGGGSENAGNARAGSAAEASSQHQVQGLAHPLSKGSTAGVHVQYFFGGIKQGFIYPIGSGLGIVRGGGGGEKSEDTSALNTTEYDISDAFITMGVVGGFLYLATVGTVLWKTIAFSRSAPIYIALPLVSVIVAMVGSWVALGQYGVGPLLWFAIGSLTRDRAQTATQPAALQSSRLQQLTMIAPPQAH